MNKIKKIIQSDTFQFWIILFFFIVFGSFFINLIIKLIIYFLKIIIKIT